MKFAHISDLHLGKRVNEYSMLEDQKYILARILNILDDEKPDALLISGDIYDKSIPSAEAVSLFDDFIVRLAQKQLRTFVISGNHDSPERLSFGNRLIDMSGIHISPVYNGSIKPTVLSDKFGDVNIYMLPFIKPAHVRAAFSEAEIADQTAAVRFALQQAGVDPAARNVLLAHQFVTGAERSDSEDISVGGTDNVDAAVFADFDYVALGHIHRPQNAGGEKIRYCGSPLKYSFSEAPYDKSVTIAELGEKGSLAVKTVPLVPMREMREIKGSYDELMSKSYYDGTDYTDAYMHITLTDEDDIPFAAAKLQQIYKNLMKLDYDNSRTRHKATFDSASDVERKTPQQLFADFFEQQNGRPLSEEQAEIVESIIKSIWEGEQ